MASGLQTLERALGYRYRDPALLELALTHRSAGARNNERLEFLGDAALSCVVVEMLFKCFGEAEVGKLHLMKIDIVSNTSLAEAARGLGLPKHIRLGPVASKGGVQHQDSPLADCLEAIIGSILLDGGMDACRERIDAWFGKRLRAASPGKISKDSKTALQEYMQGRGQPVPVYRLLKTEGPVHRRQFTVSCSVERLEGEDESGLERTGRGSSRRKAEQAAAAAMLEAIHEQG